MKHSPAEENGAKLSLSLSCAVNPPKIRKRSRGGADGVYECKTCNRKFPSFQALGGHRTSHQRPRIGLPLRGWKLKPSVHKCSVCGLAFPMGQALGGHMRRHRVIAAATAGALLSDELMDLNSASLTSEDGSSDDGRMIRASSRHDLLLLELFK